MKREVGREDFEVNEDGAVGKEVGLTERSTTINDQPSQERGASLVEYALLVALVALIGLGGVRTLGTKTSDIFYKAAATDVIPCDSNHPNFPDC